MPMCTGTSSNLADARAAVNEIRAGGSTNLTRAANLGTELINGLKEIPDRKSTSRLIFMTDLCSTANDVDDEKTLVQLLKDNSKASIYSTVRTSLSVSC